jgi:clan AA aspartic protease
MILGHVNEFSELVIPLGVRGPTGLEKQIELVLDTGFSSSIALPKDLIQELQLNHLSRTRAMLADGSIHEYQNYTAEVLWNRQWLPVVVMCLGEESLLGTHLLAGHELNARFVNSGQITIAAIE